ncbi:MAG: LLM class F420-dependent oxidoreductase [Acidimicrobiia bacterium]|nr:LLM class F420-dependent oxidoreductase [Acidimicrobiia bacterium]MDH5519550.1 LLM class F420-dependent oxidoreductase [Acidimicrobiia bacterium]
MKLGVMLDYAVTGSDRSALRDYLQAIEDLGIEFVTVPEHVVGAHPDVLGEATVHRIDRPYHEPFVLFGFVAGATRNLELATSIVILPQRQTVLFAKQSALLDRLCDGRLRLGVGIGRNRVEYQALNENFTNRGRRLEEQLDVVRGLWSNEEFTFHGQWHAFDRIGLNPMPIQRPIPIWMGSYKGGTVERVIERIGRRADGWMPQMPPDDEFDDVLGRIHGYAAEAGRDPSALGIEALDDIAPDGGPDQWRTTAEAFRARGVTHLKAVLKLPPSDPDAASPLPANEALVERWLEAVTP